MALLSLSGCARRDKVKTGSVTAPTAPGQGADGVDEGLITGLFLGAFSAVPLERKQFGLFGRFPSMTGDLVGVSNI